VFQVMAEEASLVRYRLRARVSFDPDLALMRTVPAPRRSRPYTQVSSPVLIVPVLETQAAFRSSFEEAGEWFEAVRKVSETQHGAGPD
jgi:hypothetical protein